MLLGNKKNKNITIAHRLLKRFPALADFFILSGGLVFNIKNKAESGMACLYLHQIKNRHLPAFKKLITELKKEFIFVSTGEAAALLDKDDLAGKKYLHLSFDDSFASNYLAAIIMKELNVPAVFFIATDFIGGSKDQEQALTWDEVREMSRLGFEIGSHSCSHANFSGLTDEDARREMIDSKNIIEREIGKEITSFGFPYGRLTDFKIHQLEMLRQAGYREIFTTELKLYREKNTPRDYWCRFGIEPYLNTKSVKILMNGLLAKFRQN